MSSDKTKGPQRPSQEKTVPSLDELTNAMHAIAAQMQSEKELSAESVRLSAERQSLEAARAAHEAQVLKDFAKVEADRAAADKAIQALMDMQAKLTSSIKSIEDQNRTMAGEQNAAAEENRTALAKAISLSDKADKRFESLAGTVEGIFDQLKVVGGIEPVLKDMASQISALKSSSDEVSKAVAQLKTEMNARFDAVDSGINDLNSKVAQIVDLIETVVKSIEALSVQVTDGFDTQRKISRHFLEKIEKIPSDVKQALDGQLKKLGSVVAHLTSASRLVTSSAGGFASSMVDNAELLKDLIGQIKNRSETQCAMVDAKFNGLIDGFDDRLTTLLTDVSKNFDGQLKEAGIFSVIDSIVTIKEQYDIGLKAIADALKRLEDERDMIMAQGGELREGLKEGSGLIYQQVEETKENLISMSRDMAQAKMNMDQLSKTVIEVSGSTNQVYNMVLANNTTVLNHVAKMFTDFKVEMSETLITLTERRESEDLTNLAKVLSGDNNNDKSGE